MRCMRRPGGGLEAHTLGVMSVSGARIQEPWAECSWVGQLRPLFLLACDGDAMPRCDLSTGLVHSPGPPVKPSAPGSWSLGDQGAHSLPG